MLAADVGQLAQVGAVCVSAAAAAISGVVASITLVRSRRSHGASQLYAFIVAWDTPAVMGLRHRAAAGRLKDEAEFTRDAFEVLNFFETIGYMVNDVRVISERACWLAFSDALTCYVEAFRPWIDEYREHDPTVYASLRWLEHQMLRMTERELRQYRGAPAPYAAVEHAAFGIGRPTEAQVRSFLLDESELPDDREALATTTTVVAMPPITINGGG